MICIVCGREVNEWILGDVINEPLANTWKLSPSLLRQFTLRESQYCPYCRNSARTRALAQAIIKSIPFEKSRTFKEWIKKARQNNLKIAEINSCGKLHQFLTKVPLAYSEYYDGPRILRKIKSALFAREEDITNLSYKDNTFDLVLHSEVLEHVPDYHKALLECRRVLKPGGICLFTIPIIPERKTIKRAEIVNGEIKHLELPSYHGSTVRDDLLVFWEFGEDFIKKEKLNVILPNPTIQTYVFGLSK